MSTLATGAISGFYSAQAIEVNNPGTEELIAGSGFVFRSHAMKKVAELTKFIAKTPATVLIFGRTGTGKELIARAIHALSNRPNFVVMDCTVLPADLIENELFGSEKGSYTGALGKRGLIECAEGGTLFIDEISELALPQQVKLLRFLEEGTIRHIGGNQEIRVRDVRIVVATNRDLLKMVADGKFREDLYERLDVLRIDLPSLSERKEDIPALAAFFMKKFGISEISVEVLESLMAHAWPRNVRELRNVMHRASIMHSDGSPIRNLELRRLAGAVSSADHGAGYYVGDDLGLDALIKRHLRFVLNRSGGNISKAATTLRMCRQSLRRKLRKYDIGFSEDV